MDMLKQTRYGTGREVLLGVWLGSQRPLRVLALAPGALRPLLELAQTPGVRERTTMPRGTVDRSVHAARSIQPGCGWSTSTEAS